MARNLIVGYGTLLWRESLGHTIGPVAATGRELIPVTVAGYRRLYNFAPEHYEPSGKLGAPGSENSAANVEKAKGCAFNGLAFEASDSEMGDLDRRERNYDRVRVPLAHFDTGEFIGEGFVYVFPATSESVVRDPARLLPRWLDFRYARRGAYSVSRAFGLAFDETTFLADGTTPAVSAFESRLEELMAE
ncbi:MAG: gamma-glutamylcyclotransferase family protein [Planctomycetota bacterium]|jgi:hypothetical protein